MLNERSAAVTRTSHRGLITNEEPPGGCRLSSSVLRILYLPTKGPRVL